MTRQGKYNLLGIILLPLAVILAAAISTMNGVWEAYGKTYVFLFGLNLAIMLVAGLLSGLLLLWAGGERSRWLAVAPTVLTALVGGIWYLFRAIFPAEIAPGSEYIGVPQYLATIAVGAAVIVFLLRLTGIVSKSA